MTSDQGLVNNLGQDVGFSKDLDVFAVDFDVRSAVLAVDHFVADADGELAALAVFQQLAGANGDDLAALGLFLGGVGQHDAASGALFGFDGLDNDAVIEGADFDFGCSCGHFSNSSVNVGVVRA